ncbi:hypothetical protein SIID45300_00921 [Candidatus Magnetaquicoccaceae bacterium FCR-1]|uniref:Uncharacterized protein n=1 Tax=Candidatus Magnetaquiglobus chichijimensis TaxID=3141448 RepID=A0ABQ0C6V1_9PROT
MNTPSICHDTSASCPDEREFLARRLFEPCDMDPGPLMEQGPWNPAPPHPAPDELLTTLANGLKKFQISCW